MQRRAQPRQSLNGIFGRCDFSESAWGTWTNLTSPHITAGSGQRVYLQAKACNPLWLQAVEASRAS
ncbi:hypothetical protein ACFL5O_03625 [Myxococcota bacterium]